MSLLETVGRIVDRIRTYDTLTGLGKLLIALGVVLSFAALVVPGLVDTALSSVGGDALTGLSAVTTLVVCIAVLVVQLRDRDRAAGPETLSRPALETGQSRGAALLGREFDRTLSKARQARPWAPAVTTPEESEIESTLREAAIDAYRRTTGVAEETARQAVDTGSWTDDQVAAVTLANEASELQLPATLWFRQRVDPGGAYREQIERTTAAIAALEEEQP